jgi:hypothetical protein
MGLDYSYEFITATDQLGRLHQAVAAYLPEQSRRRFAYVTGDHAPCLTFRFASDGALARYTQSAATELVEVGCLYVSRSIGLRHALLRATAATTDMSLLFEESPSVREAMRDIGRAAGALCVLLDRETDQYAQLWPEQRQISLASHAGVVPEDDVDAWCGAILAATSTTDGPPLGWPAWEQRWLTRDRGFYESLGEERADHQCREESCRRGAVPLSVHCRIHHFAHVLGRPCPFDD